MSHKARARVLAALPGMGGQRMGSRNAAHRWDDRIGSKNSLMSGTSAVTRPMLAFGSASSEIAYGSKLAWITTQLSKNAVVVLFLPSCSLLTWAAPRPRTHWTCQRAALACQ